MSPGVEVNRREWLCGALAALCVPSLAAPARAATPAPVEPPVFLDRIKSGDLPPIASRLPAEPLVVDVEAAGRSAGRYGGTLRLLEGQAKDTRRMVVFGYARLAGYTPSYEIVPDLARAIDVEAGRIFTIHLRRGHRWSDGEPFTAEDFRYFWEDVAGNRELSPDGPPRELLVDGQPPKVTFVDEVTIRYEWPTPNPFFLPGLAASQPLEIFKPAHYLKQFHKKYADPAKLQKRVTAKGQRNWVALHFKYDQSYKNSNVALPSLQPWVLATDPPSDRFSFVRNPFFHRIDSAGHQLPYIDEVAMTIASSKLIPAKTGAGESDLQADYLDFGNYAFLKQASGRNGFDVRRWKSGKGSRVTLFPNLNANDEVWRNLFRQADFRRALSLAINRDDVDQAIYYGLARPTTDTVLPESPLYDPALPGLWATYDPDRANALLDRLQLVERDAAGMRLLPDGRPMTLVVETAGEDVDQVDVLQLVTEDYRRIGIRLLTKVGERDNLTRRVASGATLMSVWTGLENALPTADASPGELAPTNSDQFEWSAWGLYFETSGQAGKKPDMPVAEELLALNANWQHTTDETEKAEIWRKMLRINADQALRIGIVAGVDQVVVVSRRLRNVPDSGIFNWNPGAFFGMYRPETFYFVESNQVSQATVR